MLRTVLILAPFVFSFAFGLDIYIPIAPQMTQIFNTTPALVQLSMSLFLFITGAGQLIIGPLSDHFGRRSIFFLASACYALGSLGCAFSTHIVYLLLGRALSAFGACGMLVTAFAFVRDLYSNRESAKMYSFLNGAIGISPIFAPLLGGHLAVAFGWRSIFFFLAGIGLCSFWITKWFIDETLPKQNRVAIDKSLFHRYVGIFSHREFLIYATIAGLAEGVFFCFFSISPYIIIDLHGIATEDFGYYFATFGSVIAFGGLASGKLIEKVGIRSTMGIGISLLFIGGFSMLGWHYVEALSLAGFLLPMVIACTGAIFLTGGSAALALEPFPAIAGTAAAAFGALEFGLSAIIGTILMLFPITSTLLYAISIVLMAISSFTLFLCAKPERIAA